MSVGLLRRVTGLGHVPAERLFEHAECVLDIEPAKKCLPQHVDLGGIEIDARVPQPYRFRDSAGWQACDVEPDYRAFDHRVGRRSQGAM